MSKVRVGGVTRDWDRTDAYYTRLYSRLSGCNTVKGNLDRLPVVQLCIPKGVKTILDIGGSDGQTSEFFTKARFDPTVLNIDADKVEICKAKGLKTIHSDMHWIDAPDESFDMVYSSHNFEYTPAPFLLLCEFHRVSKKYAMLLVPKYPCGLGSEKDGPSSPNHISVLTDLQWKQVFKFSHWKLVKYTEPRGSESLYLLEKIVE